MTGTGPRGLAPDKSPLLTDLYQLTMLQAYFDRGMHAPACSC
jgi:nicotinic acid phosphoribosyltransferase